MDYESNFAEPMAIIGMACRWPGGITSPKKLWDVLISQKSGRCKIPESRFNGDAFYHPDVNRRGTITSVEGYFLEDDPRKFDNTFFGISPLEAKSMDPQQRQLLEVVYEGIESAGIGLDCLSGSSTACFVGNFTSDYERIRSRDPEANPSYALTGEGLTMLSNRISYIFNLHGPSMTIDTACSSSLYALHMACNALQSGDATMAIVAGTNLILGPDQFISSTKLGVLSPTGACHTFDEAADGYARGEGVASLIVKKLGNAVKDGDMIRAVIKATAVNSNGKTAGITQPNAASQEAVIRHAYSRAGIEDLSRTGYFEFHGTGTPVGDPIEAEAVSRVFSSYRTVQSPLLIGSIKTNLGHSEAASGLAGVIKAVLAVENGLIPPVVGFQNPNSKIDFEAMKLKVVQTTEKWPAISGGLKRASINSFGYGGANAHVIIDAVSTEVSEEDISNGANQKHTNINGISGNPSEKSFIIPFSAHSPISLGNLKEQIFEAFTDYKVSEVAYVLARRKSLFQHKGFIVLKQSDSHSTSLLPKYGSSLSQPLRIALVFTGQGAQWPLMGSTLFHEFPHFRSTIENLDAILQALPEPPTWTISDRLLDSESSNEIHKAEYAQTLCTAIQIALVELLAAWNIFACATVGHSSGEIAAAFAAGYLTAEEAIVNAFFRGAALRAENLTEGAMLAVGLGESAAIEHIRDCVSNVSVGCINSPNSVTLSGNMEDIKKAQKIFQEHSIFNRLLQTDGKAYHSPQMEGVSAIYYRKLLEATTLEGNGTERPNVPMFSSMLGRHIEPSDICSSYWKQNLLKPVRFTEAVTGMFAAPDLAITHMIEIGPHPALEGPLRQNMLAMSSTPNISYFPTLRRNGDSIQSMMELVGGLYLAGHPINFERMNELKVSDELSMKPILTKFPPYPWDHSGDILWEEPHESQDWRFRKHPRHDILGSKIHASGSQSGIWKNILRIGDLGWLKDHKLGNEVVFPAAGYISLAVEGARQLTEYNLSVNALVLRNLSFKAPLVLPSDNTSVDVFTRLQPCPLTTRKTSDNAFDFVVSSYKEGIWTENATGTVGVSHEVIEQSLGAKEQKLASTGTSTAWYEAFKKVGLVYGPAFARLREICANSRSNTATASFVARNTKYESRYAVHPTDIDLCLQCALVPACGSRLEKIVIGYVPTFVDQITIWIKELPEEDKMIARGTLSARGMRNVHLSSSLTDTRGVRLVQIDGAVCTAFTGSTFREDVYRDPFVRIIWKPDLGSVTTAQSATIFPPKEIQGLGITMRKIERLCILSVLRIEEQLRMNDHPQSIDYLRAFGVWATKEAQKIAMGGNSTYEDLPKESIARKKEIEQLAFELQGEIFESRIVKLIHDNFFRIWCHETNVIDLLLKDDLATLYVKGLGSVNAYTQLRRAMDLCGHKNPNINILEIGAGTGGATRAIFDELNATEPLRRYHKYTYTDISPGFLAKARQEFQACQNVEYRILDLEKPPEDQGFASNEFDVIVAANVIHATSNITTALRNCNSLLKTGGYLFLLEVTRDHILPKFMLGCFPGFWQNYQDGRTDGPFLDKSQWASHLTSAGFSGLNFIADDYPEPIRLTSLIVSTKWPPCKAQFLKESPKKQPYCRPCTLIYRRNLSPSSSLLIKALREQMVPMDIISLREVAYYAKLETVISVVELEGSVFIDIDELEFKGIQRITNSATSILWIGSGGLLKGTDPYLAIMSGLARTVMSEQPSTHIWTLDIQPGTDLREAVNIQSFIQRFMAETAVDSRESTDYEYILQNGQIYVSRLIPDHALNSNFRCANDGSHAIERPLDSGQHLCLDMENLQVGLLDTLQFTEDPSVWDSLQPDDVEIHVKTLGVNMKDVLICMGNVDQRKFGQEIAGIVSRVGQGVKEISPGDRVVAFTESQYNTSQRTKGFLCQKLRENESFLEMATMPIVFSTVLYGLVDIAHLQPGESVLLTAAAGGVGIAAIQLAQSLNAKIYCTVGTSEKREFLHQHYGIPYENIFDSRTRNFATQLLTVTDGNGVDVILSSVAGELMHEAWRCIAPFGRFVDIGRRDVLEAGKLDLSRFTKSTSFTSFDLMQVFKRKPAAMAKLLATTVSLFRQGKITSITPVKVFDVSELKNALRFFMKGTHIGKVVISFENKQSRLKISTREKPLRFKPDASYLLVGCLGGLGRSMVHWMVERGATSFVFLCRSGTDKIAARELVAELEARDVRAKVARGDVTSQDDVIRAVRMAPHPIHGVIQAAMVLRDGLFNSMSLAAFRECIRPKTIGTMNLHNCTLEQPLDFFVMTSSLSGTLGTVTQSNYSAANSFLDSFARYRHTLGRPATSLALGMVTGVGYVAEHEDVEKALTRNGFYGIDEKEFLYALELSMKSTTVGAQLARYDPAAAAFILTGLEPIKLLELMKKGFNGGTFWSKDVRLRNIFRALEESSKEEGYSRRADSMEEIVSKATRGSKQELVEAVTSILSEKLSSLLLTPREQVTPERRLTELGLDSMIGAEIRNWLYKELYKIDVPFLEILNPVITLKGLSERVAEELNKVLVGKTKEDSKKK